MAYLNDLNEFRVRGHLGSNARLIPSQSEEGGSAGVGLRLVTNRFYGEADASGNRRKDTTGFDITCWAPRGMDFAGLKKGANVEVVGRVEFREGKRQDGSKGMFCNVIAREVIVHGPQPARYQAQTDDPGPSDKDAEGHQEETPPPPMD